MANLIPAPQPGEYKPYAFAYVSLVPEGGRISEILKAGARATEELMRS
jgi:hypothetical protein